MCYGTSDLHVIASSNLLLSGMSVTKRNSSATTTTSTKVCCFCNSSEDNELEYGKFYKQDGIVTHYYCLLLSSNMEQKGDDDEGILGFLAEDIHKELRRGKKLACSYCRKLGATLGCCDMKCKRIFHLPCGVKAGSMHQFFGEFKSFCRNHRPKQKIDEQILQQISNLSKLLCYICYDKINPKEFINTLWAPCCKKDAWFHRKCVQQLALSAGYFFKCPLCNNTKEFQSAMQQHGIYIPSQDASWELVPNAFEELLYRHDQCDATICLCPKGRKHKSSNAKWELVLCRICGSQGIHMVCGKLKWANPVWECVECTSILRNVKDRENAKSDNASDSSSLTRDSDSDDSDSDISVGSDFPTLCSLPSPSSSSILINPTIKSRPGPRSFKLQQQVKAYNNMFNSFIKSCAPTFTSTSTMATVSTISTTSTTTSIATTSIATISTATIITTTTTTTTTSTCNSSCTISTTNATKSVTDKVSKENNAAQESKVNISQQTSKKDSYFKKEMTDISVKPHLNLNKEVITIESDDDDDIKIIALKGKVNVPTPSPSRANIFPSVKPISLNNIKIKSADESTNENVLSKTNNASQSSAETSKKCTNDTREPDLSQLKCIQLGTPLKVNDLTISKGSPAMNIKITNVTSLPPEVFASVPNVGLHVDVPWLQSDTDVTSSAVNEEMAKLEKHSLPTKMKRGIHEEVGNVAENCKRIKAENLDNTSNHAEYDIKPNQGQEINFKIISNMKDKAFGIEDVAKYVNVSNELFSLSSSDSRKNDDTHESLEADTDKTYATIKSKDHHSKRSDSDSKINVQPSGVSDSVKLYSDTVQPNERIYSVSSSNVYFQSISSNTSQKTESIVKYAATSSDVTPSVIQKNTVAINNRQSVIVSQPIIDDAINDDNKQTRESSNQQAGFSEEKTPGDPPVDNGSSSRIVCDGDAGKTNPAVTPTRSACFFGAANIAGASDARTDLGQRRGSTCTEGRKESKHKACDESNTMHVMSFISRNRNLRTDNVFPRVTNNHNTCHQPRLIPQYMYLRDLKFKVCGAEIKMAMFDTFSVDISAANSTKSRQDELGVSATHHFLPSQVQYEASSSSRHVDSDSLPNCMTDDRTKYIANRTEVAGTSDDAKENLDPVSRTVSCNVTSSNISPTNDVNEVEATSDARQREHDTQTRFTPSCVITDGLGRLICNITADSFAKKTDNFGQGPQVDHREDVRRKQFTPSTGESGWLSHRRTIHNIDSNLNIVRTNKNAEKVLHNSVTVMPNRHVDDKEIDGSLIMDSPGLLSHNLPYVSLNRKRRKNTSSKRRSRTGERNETSIPNITFNEYSISNRQIDACDSNQLIRCVAFQRNEHNGGYSNDPSVKVSIDLQKVQKLINSKPELFVNDKEDQVNDDDGDGEDEDYHPSRRRRRRVSLKGDGDHTQQQVKFHEAENNLNLRSRTRDEKIEARDSSYANANTLNRHRRTRQQIF